jgi:hypothetical protein
LQHGVADADSALRNFAGQIEHADLDLGRLQCAKASRQFPNLGEARGGGADALGNVDQGGK